jgi:hypothetical protein
MRRCDLHLLITLLVFFKLLALVSPVPLWFTASDYPFGIFQTFVPTRDKTLKDTKRVIRRCKSERDRWYKGQKFERLQFQKGQCEGVNQRGTDDTRTFVPCITCPSLIYTFWFPFWYLSKFCPLYHLSLSDLHLLITPLESSNLIREGQVIQGTKLWKIPKG